MENKFPKFKAHPWHGVSPGDNVPQSVNCFIEIVPGDTIKYEIDKASGYLKIDRPQQYSNVAPLLYGFIPQTYCGSEVAKLAGTEAHAQPLHRPLRSDRTDVGQVEVVIQRVVGLVHVRSPRVRCLHRRLALAVKTTASIRLARLELVVFLE